MLDKTGLSAAIIFAKIVSFQLSTNLKMMLAGKRDKLDNEVIAATNAYFEKLSIVLMLFLLLSHCQVCSIYCYISFSILFTHFLIYATS